MATKTLLLAWLLGHTLQFLLNRLHLDSDTECPTILVDCQIMIQTQWAEQDARIQILIADNGCGIDPKIQSRIFDPFFTTKPVGAGTGLGLAIAYQIIHNNHGGELVLRSQPGVGTECWIDLPIRLKHDQT